MFVTSQGHAYARFRRALDTGNPALVRAAAAEVPRVALLDALRVCWALRDDDALYERACVRWIGRFCLEAKPSLEGLDDAIAALCALPHHPDHSLRALTELCREHRLA